MDAFGTEEVWRLRRVTMECPMFIMITTGTGRVTDVVTDMRLAEFITGLEARISSAAFRISQTLQLSTFRYCGPGRSD